MPPFKLNVELSPTSHLMLCDVNRGLSLIVMTKFPELSVALTTPGNVTVAKDSSVSVETRAFAGHVIFGGSRSMMKKHKDCYCDSLRRHHVFTRFTVKAAKFT